MVSSIIWVVIHARKEVPLRPLFDQRFRDGADLMYVNRFQNASALEVGDRIVDHFGGPSGSDPWAQHIVQAGCVIEKARPLNQGDLEKYPMLFCLTIEMFPYFQTAPGLLERQGIIKYRQFRPPPGVVLLPRPYRQPRPGDNFKRFIPGNPEYPQLDAWWHAVVPRGQCGKE
ncbi:MAG TPA: hypothetical protein DCY61_05770 [Dehalococcoidia bacterium]|nr:hypothetical protein [Dehalococcoidia bacterium]